AFRSRGWSATALVRGVAAAARRIPARRRRVDVHLRRTRGVWCHRPDDVGTRGDGNCVVDRSDGAGRAHVALMAIPLSGPPFVPALPHRPTGSEPTLRSKPCQPCPLRSEDYPEARECIIS